MTKFDLSSPVSGWWYFRYASLAEETARDTHSVMQHFFTNTISYFLLVLLLSLALPIVVTIL